jgi:hypothetical protein
LIASMLSKAPRPTNVQRVNRKRDEEHGQRAQSNPFVPKQQRLLRGRGSSFLTDQRQHK